MNYRKRGTTPMEPWTSTTNMDGVSLGDDDRGNGSPKHGDMIAHDRDNPSDKWLINAGFFEKNYEPAE